MIRMNDSVLLSRIDNEVVILDPDSNLFYGLNVAGSRMLDLLTEHADLETAIRFAEQEIEAPAGCVRKDFLKFFDELSEKGLVKVHAV